jgi:hypothetical protein
VNVREKLAAIKESGLFIAYDGCHKIYLLDSVGEVAEARSIGYDIYPDAEVERLFDRSCGLEFVQPWSLGHHPWEIRQGEEEDEQS